MYNKNKELSTSFNKGIPSTTEQKESTTEQKESTTEQKESTTEQKESTTEQKGLFSTLIFTLDIRSFNMNTTIFFKNGYGASISKGPRTQGGKEGLYELAVIRGQKDNWLQCYDTPIKDTTIGYLTEKEIEKYLEKIKLLEKDVHIHA